MATQIKERSRTTLDDPIEAVVMVDPRIDPNDFMLTNIDTTRAPLFSVGEVAKVFFARSPHWIRWLDRGGKLVLDGTPVGQGRTVQGSRKYTLSDVELMAHALAQQEAISGSQLRKALALIKIESEIYDFV